MTDKNSLVAPKAPTNAIERAFDWIMLGGMVVCLIEVFFG